MDEKKCCNVTTNNYYGCCGNGGTNSNKEVYSFDEIEIGTWVDGKTIYRKVIEGTLANTSGDHITFANVSELNIESLISLKGYFVSKNGTRYHIPLSGNSTTGIVAVVNMNYVEGTKELKYHFLNNNGTFSDCSAYVILDYTKQDA